MAFSLSFFIAVMYVFNKLGVNSFFCAKTQMSWPHRTAIARLIFLGAKHLQIAHQAILIRKP